ncbi:hypothetical protein SUGI_0131940 [Cryptomeria japonica]|nr:hypothetical protein SUGI_0131940 [Cryptomeria japonica]
MQVVETVEQGNIVAHWNELGTTIPRIPIIAIRLFVLILFPQDVPYASFAIYAFTVISRLMKIQNFNTLCHFFHLYYFPSSDDLPWEYVHLGVDISLDNNSLPFLKQTYNLANFHNLEVYLHALDGFQGHNKLPFT